MKPDQLAQTLWSHIDGWKRSNGRPWSRCTWDTLPESEKLLWRMAAEKAVEVLTPAPSPP